MIECYGLRRERVKETSKRKLHVFSTMEEIYTKIIACGVHVKYLRVERAPGEDGEGGEGGEREEGVEVERWRLKRMKRVERWRGWMKDSKWMGVDEGFKMDEGGSSAMRYELSSWYTSFHRS